MTGGAKNRRLGEYKWEEYREEKKKKKSKSQWRFTKRTRQCRPRNSRDGLRRTIKRKKERTVRFHLCAFFRLPHHHTSADDQLASTNNVASISAFPRLRKRRTNRTNKKEQERQSDKAAAELCEKETERMKGRKWRSTEDGLLCNMAARFSWHHRENRSLSFWLCSYVSDIWPPLKRPLDSLPPAPSPRHAHTPSVRLVQLCPACEFSPRFFLLFPFCAGRQAMCGPISGTRCLAIVLTVSVVSYKFLFFPFFFP